MSRPQLAVVVSAAEAAQWLSIPSPGVLPPPRPFQQQIYYMDSLACYPMTILFQSQTANTAILSPGPGLGLGLQNEDTEQNWGFVHPNKHFPFTSRRHKIHPLIGTVRLLLLVFLPFLAIHSFTIIHLQHTPMLLQ